MKIEFHHPSLPEGCLSEKWFDIFGLLNKGTIINISSITYKLDEVVIDLDNELVQYKLLKT